MNLKVSIANPKLRGNYLTSKHLSVWNPSKPDTMTGQAVLSLVARYSQFRGIQSTEVYGDSYRRLGHFELSVLSQVCAVEGCPLGGVPLYMKSNLGAYTTEITMIGFATIP